jgi:hypothetical protein
MSENNSEDQLDLYDLHVRLQFYQEGRNASRWALRRKGNSSETKALHVKILKDCEEGINRVQERLRAVRAMQEGGRDSPTLASRTATAAETAKLPEASSKPDTVGTE